MKKPLKDHNSKNVLDIDYIRKVLAGLREGNLGEILDGGVGLSGKSERTTFSLSQTAIGHLENLSEVSETKIKDLIDHLVKDIAVKNIKGESDDWGDIGEIADKLTRICKERKIRKTYVISSGSLSLLNILSKILKIERNIIMENIIISYATFRQKLIEKKYPKYEKAILLLKQIARDAEEKIEQLKDALKLNDNDPLLEEIESAVFYIYHPYEMLMGLLDNPQKIIEWEDKQKSHRLVVVTG